MKNNISKLTAEILDSITKRYVIFDKPIPANILRLKDETMTIFAEFQSKPNEDIPPQYEQQLLEIRKKLHDELDKGE